MTTFTCRPEYRANEPTEYFVHDEEGSKIGGPFDNAKEGAEWLATQMNCRMEEEAINDEGWVVTQPNKLQCPFCYRPYSQGKEEEHIRDYHPTLYDKIKRRNHLAPVLLPKAAAKRARKAAQRLVNNQPPRVFHNETT
jgi:hypothetical protein